MATLAVFGGNSLLGQHVIDAAVNSKNFDAVRVWNYQEKAETRLETNNNPNLSVEYFSGLESMERIVEGAHAVINLHDCHDYSVNPDTVAMEEHNVYFVEKLIDACQKNHVQSLIHQSSIFVQCTSMFPNTYCREAKAADSAFVPFKPYADTKRRAEELLINHHSDIQIVVGRCGGMYGEGDVSSPVCDAICLSDKLGYMPVLGDRGGVYQMAYAGNIAHSMVEILEMLQQRVDIRREVVILRDDTPNQDIYSTAIIPALSSSNRSISSTSLPFYLFFPILLLLAGMNRMFNIFEYSTPLCNLPDPTYVYFTLQHWTFFNNFKQRNLFGQKPKYTFEESKSRSASYYSNILSEDVRTLSWKKNFY